MRLPSRTPLLLLAVLLLPRCQSPLPGGGRGRPASGLAELIEREWEERLADDPLQATAVGRHGWNALLPSVAPADLERRLVRAEEFVRALEAIDSAGLSRQDAISRSMLLRELRHRIAQQRFGAWMIPVNSDSGFHTRVASLPRDMPLRSIGDHEDYLTRLRGLPAYFEQQIENMRRGLASGRSLPREILDGFEHSAAAHVVDDPRESLFFGPFLDLPASVPPRERERLVAAGEAAVREGVVPAYAALAAFFRDEYLPGARATLACSDLPDGRAWYEHLVRHFTTLDVTPEEVHGRGLEEVARIRAEMLAVVERAGFEGDLAAFIEHLRTDPRFYAETPEELLREAAWICKRMDAALPALFGRLPRQPYGVEPVPAHIAPRYTAGRYVSAALESEEPGYYWVNTHALESRPLYALVALSLHEAVPGHHLQISLAQELDLPEFRRHGYVTAYGEGWGLYSERLGLEAGFYDDPYDDFGRLTYEMWRACRLVVDTGLHALGWSRERARAYLADNTALSLHEVGTEIDRYVSWPGQALAYKIGELEIRRLRARAEEELGPRFDLRRFHDVLLGSGGVPLDVLGELVEGYVTETAGGLREPMR